MYDGAEGDQHGYILIPQDVECIVLLYIGPHRGSVGGEMLCVEDGPVGVRGI